MSDNSAIEWTDATWNPVTGCTKVSPGCDHCYAETFAERWRGTPGHHFENGFDVTLRPERLAEPLRWRKPRRVFVNSMSDLFHDDVPTRFIAKVFATMARTPQHTYQLLTKRHGRMRHLIGDYFDGGVNLQEELWMNGDEEDAKVLYDTLWPLPNVWLGVSVENQKWADIRVPALLKTAAAVHFLSCEPLLGPVKLDSTWLSCGHGAESGTGAPGVWRCDSCCAIRREVEDPAGDVTALRADPSGERRLRFEQIERGQLVDWVIVGGESGPDARPMRPSWAQSLRDQCQTAGVPFFMKQAGAVLAREWGCSDRKGHNPDEWPEFFPREFPLAVLAAS